MDPAAPPVDLNVVPARRLARHAALLALVLVGTSLLVGTHGRYSADEGAVTITARRLAAGHGWLTPAPLPAADRGGHLYPLVSSAWGREGVSAYAKHPAYAVILSVAGGSASGWGMVAVSVFGTVLASVGAAVLARRLFAGGEILALWLVGVASPMFVDAQLLMAHTLAAAGAVGAVLAVDLARRSSGARRWAWLATVGVAVAATVLLRTEGVVFGVALAIACVLSGRWPTRRASADDGARHVRAFDLLLAGSAAAGVAVAVVVERAWFRSIVGTPVADPSRGVPLGAGGFLNGRVHAFVLTMLRPAYGTGAGSILLVLALGLLLLSLVAALRRRPDLRASGVLVAAAGVVVLVRAVAVEPDGVPGLLVAFPLGWAGLVAAGRSSVADERRRLVAVTVGLFVIAVAATQYAVGGGVEWGGRYFALAIPLVAPAAAAGIRSVGARMDGAVRRIAGAGLVAMAVGLAVLGVRELHDTGSAADDFYAHLPTATAGLGHGPVIVTTDVLLPRLAGRTFEQDRWLLADREHPDRDLVARLRAAGIRRFVLVTDDPAADAPLVAGAHRLRSSQAAGHRFDVYATGP